MPDNLTIGIDLGGTNTRAGLVTAEGEIVGRARRSTPVDDGADSILSVIAECAVEAAEDGTAFFGPLGMFAALQNAVECLFSHRTIRFKPPEFDVNV